jgi:hypothetical protein
MRLGGLRRWDRGVLSHRPLAPWRPTHRERRAVAGVVVLPFLVLASRIFEGWM